MNQPMVNHVRTKIIREVILGIVTPEKKRCTKLSYYLRTKGIEGNGKVRIKKQWQSW